VKIEAALRDNWMEQMNIGQLVPGNLALLGGGYFVINS